MAGQLSLQEAHYDDPRDLAEVMEVLDNSDSSGLGWPETEHNPDYPGL